MANSPKSTWTTSSQEKSKKSLSLLLKQTPEFPVKENPNIKNVLEIEKLSHGIVCTIYKWA